MVSARGLDSGSNHGAVHERRTRSRIVEQLRIVGPLAVVWSLGVIVLLTLLGRGPAEDAKLLLDPAAVAGLPWYTGLISNLGVLMWTLATVSAIHAAHVARLGARRRAAAFLSQAAGLSLLLTLDDLLLLHSNVIPQVSGMPKSFVLLVYLTAIGGWITSNIAEVRRTRWLLLAASSVAFFASIVVDQLLPGHVWSLLVEDSAKFLGIIAWATYFHLTSRDISHSVVRQLVDAHIGD